VKKITAHTEVIVLTAYETLDAARQAISFGASEYLKKPFDLDHIQKVVDRLLQALFVSDAARYRDPGGCECCEKQLP
jgi:DNA-binding NtrC family response regulator